MATVTLTIWRRGAELQDIPNEEIPRAHQERSLLLHGMRNALGIGVLNWGEVDDEQPHEIIEAVIQFITVVIPVLVPLWKLWVDTKKIDEIEIKTKSGSTIKVKGATPAQIDALLRSAT